METRMVASWRDDHIQRDLDVKIQATMARSDKLLSMDDNSTCRSR